MKEESKCTLKYFALVFGGLGLDVCKTIGTFDNYDKAYNQLQQMSKTDSKMDMAQIWNENELKHLVEVITNNLGGKNDNT